MVAVLRLHFFVCFIAFFSSSLWAAPLQLRLGVGLEQDSAVAFELLDTGNNEYAPVTDTGTSTEFEFESPIWGGWRGYTQFGTMSYRNASENDSTSLSGGLAWERAIGAVDTQVDIAQTNMQLDGDDFLTLQSIGSALSYFSERGFFVMANLGVFEKAIAINSDLDARTLSYGGQGFWFFNGYKSYAKLALTRNAEDAIQDGFDYDETLYTVALKHRLRLGIVSSDMLLSAEWRARDYPKVITENRKTYENRTRFTVQLTHALTDTLSLRTAFETSTRDSDQTLSSYDSHVTSLKLTYRFSS